MQIEKGYEKLMAVFQAAHDQAAHGKGKERHANGLPFHEQRMQSISKTLASADGMAYQVVKKMTKACSLMTISAVKKNCWAQSTTSLES